MLAYSTKIGNLSEVAIMDACEHVHMNFIFIETFWLKEQKHLKVTSHVLRWLLDRQVITVMGEGYIDFESLSVFMLLYFYTNWWVDSNVYMEMQNT